VLHLSMFFSYLWGSFSLLYDFSQFARSSILSTCQDFGALKMTYSTGQELLFSKSRISIRHITTE